MTMLHSYILLDRTGSMSGRWEEALSSVNAYVDELNSNKTKTKVTVCCFDSQEGLRFDVLRDSVNALKYKPLSDADASPRGMTPLLDALGRIISMIESADKKLSALIVMTDGEENSSREVSKSDAAMAVQRCKDRNWQVVFLGADFDAFGEAESVGVATSTTLNMTKGNYAESLRGLAVQATTYASTGESICFSAVDRKTAAPDT